MKKWNKGVRLQKLPKIVAEAEKLMIDGGDYPVEILMDELNRSSSTSVYALIGLYKKCFKLGLIETFPCLGLNGYTLAPDGEDSCFASRKQAGDMLTRYENTGIEVKRLKKTDKRLYNDFRKDIQKRIGENDLPKLT